MDEQEPNEPPEPITPLDQLIAVVLLCLASAVFGSMVTGALTVDHLADDWSVETTQAWQRLRAMKAQVDSIEDYYGSCRTVFELPWMGLDTVTVTKFCYKEQAVVVSNAEEEDAEG